jgi:hypothetical protein
MQRMFKATPSVQHPTPRRRAEEIGTDANGFDLKPSDAQRFGMTPTKPIEYDHRAGHPVAPAFPQGTPEAAPEMKPAKNAQRDERSPFVVDGRK